MVQMSYRKQEEMQAIGKEDQKLILHLPHGKCWTRVPVKPHQWKPSLVHQRSKENVSHQ